jgi:hypothetical protein
MVTVRSKWRCHTDGLSMWQFHIRSLNWNCSNQFISFELELVTDSVHLNWNRSLVHFIWTEIGHQFISVELKLVISSFIWTRTEDPVVRFIVHELLNLSCHTPTMVNTINGCSDRLWSLLGRNDDITPMVSTINRCSDRLWSLLGRNDVVTTMVITNYRCSDRLCPLLCRNVQSFSYVMGQHFANTDNMAHCFVCIKLDYPCHS